MPRSSSRTPPSAAAARAADSGAGTKRIGRAVPWWAIAVSLLVLITSLFAVDPVRDAVSQQGVGEARLGLTAAYLSIGPFSNVLDTLTLLTVAQHIAVMVTAIALFAGWRVWRARSARPTFAREILAAVALLGGLVLVYALATLAPRPMATLTVSDETVVAVDFHAHTKYSHDGRTGWTDDDLRDWHRGAGFDVAYVTDHATYEGAERGVAANPGVAGDGVMILQGLEAVYKGEHVNILSAGRHYRGLTDAALRDVDPEALTLASFLPKSTPVLIETIPGDLSKVPASTPASPVGVQAIELIDGSPRGLSQGRRERRRIIHIADSLNLALVTGSDNHGYGRAAPGWTLIRLPGWRGMRTDSLSQMIEFILRDGRRTSTRPVERRVAGATNPLSVALSAPLVTWRMFTTLSADERVMWLIWVWALFFGMRGWRAYRVRPSAAA